MKYILFVFTFFLLQSNSYSQIEDTEDIYRKVVESQIDFERIDNSYSVMNVTFIDEKFNDLKFTDYGGVGLNTLTKEQIKLKSKKGIDLIEVHPLNLSNSKIIVETLSIFRKKNKVTIYGKSTYFFQYDCKKNKYILTHKNQKLI